MKFRIAVLIVCSLLSVFLLGGCTVSSVDVIEHIEQPIDTKTQKPLTFGLQTGDVAPPYSVMATKGMILNDSSFEGPVLLYFFATWCPYCTEDFKTLSPIYPAYEEDVDILAIDMDLKESASIIDDYAATFHNLDGVWFALGNRETLSNYQIKYTTTKYAIARNGTVLYAGSGAFTQIEWLTLLDAMRNSNDENYDDRTHDELMTV